MLHTTLVRWSKETSKRSTKTKYTCHKVNVAKEKNQKKKKKNKEPQNNQKKNIDTQPKRKITKQKMLIMHVKSPN
jgi:hypothetical protein